MPQQPDPLDQRFERLRTVVSEWEIRYNQLPDQVVSLFDAADLAAISGLLEEKRQLERLIPEMQEFIRKWEHTLTGASGLVP
ncbi:MAG: hypothetical protein WCC10_03750 [Tumebacillaceae bacterium]